MDLEDDPAPEREGEVNLAIVTGSHADVGYLQPIERVFRDESWCEATLLEAPCRDWKGHTPADISSIFAIVQQWAVHALPGYDAVLVCGDRFEILAVTTACTLLRIPLIHLFGGDETRGSADNTFRWQITAASDLVLCGDHEADDRVEFGFRELDVMVRTVGSTSLDEIKPLLGTEAEPMGLVLVMCRPATATGEDVSQAVFDALLDVPATVRWFGSAPDVGANHEDTERLPREEFIRLLARASAVVGNSSCGVLEAPYLGIPSVNVGDRQEGRHAAPSVVTVPNDAETIRAAVLAALEAGRYPSSKHYGDGGSAARCVSAVREWKEDKWQT